MLVADLHEVVSSSVWQKESVASAKMSLLVSCDCCRRAATSLSAAEESMGQGEAQCLVLLTVESTVKSAKHLIVSFICVSMTAN